MYWLKLFRIPSFFFNAGSLCSDVPLFIPNIVFLVPVLFFSRPISFRGLSILLPFQRTVFWLCFNLCFLILLFSVHAFIIYFFLLLLDLSWHSFFFFFWLRSVFIAARRLFSSCSKRGATLHCSSWASHYGGFARCGARALAVGASVVVARGL